ncbi:hypothetical protein SAMN06295973_2807 [Plantibacter cousiniae]|uniref:DUF4145 domain-containing protein n=2 Tax=Plantibacter cousiniae (nom. nud.) TaxID=199709 RepID=A0ABY1LRR1_9MICO|nr:hypothetical protein SAMN06295973_2807 [Plantibacter cousiniae]
MGKASTSWGSHRRIDVGTVTRQYYCTACESVRPFNSKKQLNCLVAGPDLVSIDVVLKCVDCTNTVENWFLLKCADDLFGQAPSVSLVYCNEHLGSSANALGPNDTVMQDLLDRADLGRRVGLAAGSIIYLRKHFEITTHTAATGVGVPLLTEKDKRRSFADILREVDQKIQIIPEEFSQDGYRLFSELSTVIHGNADEMVALGKFDALRRLVVGVFENVRNRAEFTQATNDLGWVSKGEL